MSEKQYSTIQIRRGSNAAFNSVNPVLASGEPAFAIDVGILKIGDGVTHWTNLTPITSGNIGNYALLDSPHFTGIPTAPTANSGTNTTQIATTAFVRTEVANLIDSAPALLDTLNELAAAINDDANFATTITNNIITVSGIANGGHNHTVSNITDFNSGVSGLLPSFSEGTGVQITDNTLINNTIVIDNLHTEINELSLEPQGFVNRLDSIISFNDSTRTFTIAPTGSSYDVYIEGVKVTKTTAESIVIPSSTALNYLHFDTSTGLLSNKNTSFNFDTDVPIAYIHWNSGINQSTFFGEERHGIRMDSMTHKWIHNTFGMQYIDGLSIGGYTLLGNGNSNSHAQIDISDGTLYQEDIIINITNGTGAGSFIQQLSPIAYIPVYYHSGTTGQWVRDTSTPYPLKYNGTRALYNLYSGGTWTTPNVTNNRYFAMWIVATNDINDPILTIMGQREDSSLQSAENNNNWSDINLTNIPTNELRPLYRLIFLTNDTFTNTPKSSLQSILDLRKSIITSTYGVSQNDHGNLFGLGDDDHFQYVHINESRTISANHTFNNGLTISSGLLSATSGNFASGLFVNNNAVSVSGHTHTGNDILIEEDDFNNTILSKASPVAIFLSQLNNNGLTEAIASIEDHIQVYQIENFESSVSGLLPTVANSGNNRILTSDGTSYGINAQSMLTVTDATLIIQDPSKSQCGQIQLFNNDSGDGTVGLIIFNSENQERLRLFSSDDTDINYLYSDAYPLNIQSNNNPINCITNGSGLFVDDIRVSVSGHTHLSADITNFSSSVSGLLPTIANSGNNRILTSDGTKYGINAESALTFDDNTGRLLTYGGYILVQDLSNKLDPAPDSGKTTSIGTYIEPSGFLGSPSGTHNILGFSSNVSPRSATSNHNMNYYGGSHAVYLEIPSGVTNSGGIIGGNFSAWRNARGANVGSNWIDDNGTLSRLQGCVINYGHGIGQSGVLGPAPTGVVPYTNTAYGLIIAPQRGYGTINTMYDIFIVQDNYQVGTINTHYGIYQQSNNPNYFAGSISVDNGLSSPTPVYSLGTVSGNTAINYAIDRQIQTLTLNGTSVNFTEGTGWTTANRSVDVVLQITVTSTTTVAFDSGFVTDWYSSLPTFSAGTYLILLRSIGSTVVQGHYIGKKI